MLATSSSSLSKDGVAGNGKSDDGSEALGDGSTRAEPDYGNDGNINTKGNSAEDLVRMVYGFVAGAENFTQGMDKSDEVKLLRLRTRKNEIVIYPGMKLLTTRSLCLIDNSQVLNTYLLLFTKLHQLEVALFGYWFYLTGSLRLYPEFGVCYGKGV